jgi:hypothetical protein
MLDERWKGSTLSLKNQWRPLPTGFAMLNKKTMELKRLGIVDEEEVLRIGVLPAGRGHWVRLLMKEMEVGRYCL